jgi:hypothetical protein
MVVAAASAASARDRSGPQLKPSLCSYGETTEDSSNSSSASPAPPPPSAPPAVKLCHRGAEYRNHVSLCKSKGDNSATQHMRLPLQWQVWIYGPIMVSANVTFVTEELGSELTIRGFNVSYTLSEPGTYNISVIWQFIPRSVSTVLARSLSQEPFAVVVVKARNQKPKPSPSTSCAAPSSALFSSPQYGEWRRCNRSLDATCTAAGWTWRPHSCALQVSKRRDKVALAH